jgi:hypothetical protein
MRLATLGTPGTPGSPVRGDAGMSIIRAPRPEQNYTTVSNAIIRDSRLSYRARGVLIAILSRPNHWRTDAPQLAMDGKEGRDAIRTALAELQETGYIVIHKFRTDKGTWDSDMIVFDSPQDSPHPRGFPALVKPPESGQWVAETLPVDCDLSDISRVGGDIDAGQNQNGKPALVNRGGFPGPLVSTKTKELNLGSAPADEPKPVRRKPAVPIPPDWCPSPTHKSMAHELHVDCDDEADRFRNSALAKDTRWRDWDAAYRNWMKNAVKFGRTIQPTQPTTFSNGGW